MVGHVETIFDLFVDRFLRGPLKWKPWQCHLCLVIGDSRDLPDFLKMFCFGEDLIAIGGWEIMSVTWIINGIL